MLNDMASAEPLTPALTLRRLIFGHRITQMLAVAVQLGIPDQLGDSALSVYDLAQQTQTDQQALYRLLRALSSIDIVARVDADRFALTPMGHCLRSDAHDSQRAWVLMESADFYQQAWGQLHSAVRSGKPAAEHALGMPFYQYMTTHTATVAPVFQRAMGEASQLAAQAVVAAYPLPPQARVVDIGGGYGVLLSALLRANPSAQGVLFDTPQIVAGAQARLQAAGLAERCELVGGNFFEGVPPGGDIYILSRVLMDHDDIHGIQILRQCRSAMGPHARLLIIQQVLPENSADPTMFDGVMSDLNMLVFLPGRERTIAEYRALLEASGFTLNNAILTQALMSIIEAAPSG